MSSFEEFYKRLGFIEYPFAIFSAEGERKRLETLFVKPAVYSPLVETFGNRASVIVSGERGTGKTALTYELMRNAEKEMIVVYIDDFTALPTRYTSNDLYNFLLNSFAGELFNRLALKPWLIWRRSPDEKLLLSYLLKFHVGGMGIRRMEERIRAVRLGPIKRVGLFTYNLTRGVLNYGTSVAIDITSDLIRRHFPGLPPLDQGVSREYFPALMEQKLDDVAAAQSNFSLLNRVTKIATACGFNRTLFVLDKVDEEPRLENDAAEIASFLEPLLTDHKLILHNEVQFLLACWSIPLEQLRSTVRFQKLNLQRVAWTASELMDVLNRRLETFSSSKVTSLHQLLDDALPLQAFDDLVSLANGNPRDLWHLLDSVMKNQFKLDPNAARLSTSALKDGARDFVTNFNFFEYYPRNARARATTMDVYSYIAHLQKLDGIHFTKNQLSEQASTGGSTGNYVVAMENMGLISKTDGKGQGGAVIYQIRDPKIIFAMKHGIQLNRSGA